MWRQKSTSDARVDRDVAAEVDVVALEAEGSEIGGDEIGPGTVEHIEAHLR
jgi:hypothetical protein